MAGRRFRTYSQEFKLAAVSRVFGGEKIPAVARELGLGRLLYAWLDHYEHGGSDALIPRGRPRRDVAWARRRALIQPPGRQARAYGHAGADARDSRLAELERKVGQQAVELDFFKQALRHVKAPPRPSGGRGASASSRSSTR
jgi:transposase-like protein